MKSIVVLIGIVLAGVAMCYGYEHEPEYHHYPKYQYKYGVSDHHTGDHKSQWEHRDGDKVKGGYELKEADGTKRIVTYEADDHHGFTAHVERVGHADHPAHYGGGGGGHAAAHHISAGYDHHY